MADVGSPALKPQHAIFAVLPEWKLVICLTPKVASSAIVTAISQHYGASIQRPFHGNAVFQWFKLAQVSKSIPDWRRVMFVRNPFDRLVGVYEYHIRSSGVQMSKTMLDLGFRPDMTFDEFLELVLRNTEADAHFAMQCWQTDRVDFLGRFETLGADWARMRDWAGAALPDLKVVNRSKPAGADYRGYYSDAMRGRVERAYHHDLDAYGYEF
jgi:hypothetical protein